MKQFYEFMLLIGNFLPDLVSMLLCPALLLAAGILYAVFHKKGAYLPTAVGLGGLGFFLVLCETTLFSVEAFGYLALFTVFAALLRLLFVIPFPKERNVQEEMYRKFALPLDGDGELPEEETETAEEDSGLRLDHAASLIERLEQCELAAGDRLEVDALSHTLESFRGRALTAQETRSVNDCLATILKLTAKYKL